MTIEGTKDHTRSFPAYCKTARLPCDIIVTTKDDQGEPTYYCAPRRRRTLFFFTNNEPEQNSPCHGCRHQAIITEEATRLFGLNIPPEVCRKS